MTGTLYDLVLRGGRVIDPAQGLDAALDVGLRAGRVAAVAQALSPGDAREVVDVRGQIVLPGLIDTHAHVYQYVTGRFGLEADMVGVHSGTTTVVDQGGPSCMTLPGFRKFVAEPAATRIYAFLSAYLVGGLEGHYYPALYGPDGVDVPATIRAAQENADLVRGIKAHENIVRVDDEIGTLRHAVLADQRSGEALPAMHIIETVTPFHAQPAMVGRAVASLDMQDAVTLDVVGELATHAAIRTDGIDRLVCYFHAHAVRRHQCAGGAGLHTLAASDAGRVTHGIVEIEHDLRIMPAEGIADHVVDLLLPAGAYAARALDAGIEVDRDPGMRQIRLGLAATRKARLSDFQIACPEIEFGILRVLLLGHVGKQQFQNHLLRCNRPRVLRFDFHSGLRGAAARRRQHPLPFDLHHASAAVAVGAVARLVAQMRNIGAVALRRLKYGFSRRGVDLRAIEFERHHLATLIHVPTSNSLATEHTPSPRPSPPTIGWRGGWKPADPRSCSFLAPSLACWRGRGVR